MADKMVDRTVATRVEWRVVLSVASMAAWMDLTRAAKMAAMRAAM